MLPVIPPRIMVVIIPLKLDKAINSGRRRRIPAGLDEVVMWRRIEPFPVVVTTGQTAYCSIARQGVFQADMRFAVLGIPKIFNRESDFWHLPIPFCFLRPAAVLAFVAEVQQTLRAGEERAR